MSNMKEYYQELQDAADDIDVEMTQEEMDDTIDLIMREEADAQDRLHKAQRLFSFWKGFMTGWVFVVILNLSSYFY